MSILTNTFAKRAAASLLTSTILAGCAGMTPSQGRELGQGMGTLIFGAAGAALSESSSPLGQVGATILSGYSGYEIGGALGEYRAGIAGSCERDVRTDNLRGRATSDTSHCTQQHGMPAGTPGPRY